MLKTIANTAVAEISSELVCVDTLAELISLIKEAEVLTGARGREFVWTLDDGDRMTGRITFDGYVMFSIPSAVVIDPGDVLGLSRSSMIAAMLKGNLFTEAL